MLEKVRPINSVNRMIIEAEIRNQVEEITRRAGYLWRYL